MGGKSASKTIKAPARKLAPSRVPAAKPASVPKGAAWFEALDPETQRLVIAARRLARVL
jgi:hypothetical protein